jgi:hypothetical protein
VQGKIDQGFLYDYTKRIVGLTLGAEEDSKTPLAMHLLVRIARLQDPNTPLFPSLNHLRIANASKYLDFLDIFLPSALKTIELTAISDTNPHYSSVLSFLESAIDQAPDISTLIILGPGQIQDQILHISSKYKHLRCFELHNVGVSITHQLLQDLGSLQHLETFILRDSGTSTYNCQWCFLGFCYHGDTEVDAASLFPALRTFEIGASFSLIEALVTKISPSDLQVLSIDFTLPLELRTAKQFSPHCDPILMTSGRNRKSNASTTFQPLPSASGLFSAPALLRRSIQAWGNTLVSITLKNDHIPTFSLPTDLFETLLLCPNMKRLELTGIDFDSTDIKLHRLEELVDSSKLEVLHLPVHPTAASIDFIELGQIAEKCPLLKSLRCRLRILDIPVSVPRSNGLEVLSVSNAEVQLDQRLLFMIARYLDSAFPNLKTIKTHYENGNNAEQWGLISELVKTVCQAVRRDERARHDNYCKNIVSP